MGKISRRITLVLIAVAVFIAIKYSAILNMREAYTEQWANVEAQCQRRTDLVPKLIRTIKGASIENKAIEQLTEAKVNATFSSDELYLSPNNIKKFQEAQNTLSGALTNFLDLVMLDSVLQENQGFLDMAVKLEGEENRITVERRRFNEQVRIYNTYLRKFPTTLVASIFGFERQVTFDADDGVD
jgi:LemA protein